MALWDEPGAMIDGMYTLITDDLTYSNNYKHNTLYILSVQATVLLHEHINGILEMYQYVMKAGIVKQLQCDKPSSSVQTMVHHLNSIFIASQQTD